MYGWTTWGGIVPANGNPAYREIGPMELFKHWTGPIVAVPVSVPRDDAFLMLAQMNEHLEAVRETDAILADPETMAAIEEARAELDDDGHRRWPG
jgi:hypothetical protein